MKIEAELYSNCISKKDKCLEWGGAKDKKGYGIVNWNGKNKRTHRLSYELNFGEIPKGYLICHSCDNPSCINPKHLWVGTSKENTLDMMKKGRGNFKKGIKFKDAPYRPHSKLDESKVKDIRERIKMGETMVSLAFEYNVSDRTINNINSGKLWKNIDSEKEKLARAEAVKRTRSRCASKNHSKLNEFQIKEIKNRILKGESQRKIAADYNVSQNTIFDIKHCKRWKEIK
jgi:DNA-binding XRE family transcriptional regulator